MTALVGYTGFVGSNLYAAGGIDRAYNSKNIEEAYGEIFGQPRPGKGHGCD